MYQVKTMLRFVGVIMTIVMLAGCQDKREAQIPARFPPNCAIESVLHQQNTLVLAAQLQPPAQQLYLIYNQSKQTLWLNHPAGRNTSASAGWGSKLAPQHWSAIAITQANFALSCQNTQFKTIDCYHVIRACQMTDARFPQSLSGAFWVSENQSKQATLLKQIKARHIDF